MAVKGLSMQIVLVYGRNILHHSPLDSFPLVSDSPAHQIKIVIIVKYYRNIHT